MLDGSNKLEGMYPKDAASDPRGSSPTLQPPAMVGQNDISLQGVARSREDPVTVASASPD